MTRYRRMSRLIDDIERTKAANGRTEANGHGEPFWSGPPDAAPAQPCVGCGRPSTPVVTALTVSGHGRFTAEVQPQCDHCMATREIARIEQRLADPTLHPDARAHVRDVLDYWRNVANQQEAA